MPTTASYWPSWGLEVGDAATISCHGVVLSLEQEFGIDELLEPGWRKCRDSPFPTFTTSRPRDTPGRQPAGVSIVQQRSFAIWSSTGLPVYQKRLGVRNVQGDWRLPSVKSVKC